MRVDFRRTEDEMMRCEASVSVDCKIYLQPQQVILIATTSTAIMFPTAHATGRCTALPSLPPRPFRTSFNRVSGIPINIVKSLHIPQMAATKANTIEPVRPLANFPSSVWGDRFLSFSLDNSKLEAYVKAMDQPKEQLRRLILNPSTDSNEKLSLIYSLDRLGLTYLFLEDIDGQLYKLFNQLNLQTYREADIYTISIHFQVFRKFGYRFSCDVFNKFKDFESGKFNEDISKDDLELQVKTSYVRNRVPEFYVWALTSFLEPHYSQARILLTKALLLLVVLDDTYDAYATIEEMRVLTHAINRWDITAISQLPEYIKPYYRFILNEYAEWNKQIPQQGTTNLIEASIKAFKELATAYLQEAEWRHSGEVPSLEEYMKIGLITSAIDILYKSALSGMGKIVTQEAIAWYESHPKIFTAVQFIGRLQDDVATFTFERARAPSITCIDAYMKTFGVSEDVAIEAIKNVIEDRWKDIHEGCLKPREVPMGILAPLVNIARTADVFYKYDDVLTFPENIIKEYITLLFCVSVPM
ncbi:hypothetical protein M8C21_007727 [Ambrosia artemisiifolia]|uniref:Uncharacterized protein n=1 Tax=Ambrosia artemisiifolia TaxID=4212 RepID=A0AAD5CGJ0_AMBAR|nr:hypothetical protein M8C21_007727 [Ambrosia artemisiifolia]